VPGVTPTHDGAALGLRMIRSEVSELEQGGGVSESAILAFLRRAARGRSVEAAAPDGGRDGARVRDAAAERRCDDGVDAGVGTGSQGSIPWSRRRGGDWQPKSTRRRKVVRGDRWLTKVGSDVNVRSPGVLVARAARDRDAGVAPPQTSSTTGFRSR
jgi:hypothetical protein